MCKLMMASLPLTVWLNSGVHLKKERCGIEWISLASFLLKANKEVRGWEMSNMRIDGKQLFIVKGKIQ